MKKRAPIILSLLTVVLLTFVALAVAEGPAPTLAPAGPEQDASLAPAQTHTITLPYVSNPDPILLFDDFNTTDGGWPVADSGEVRWFYRLGQYIMSIEREEWWAGAVPEFVNIENYSVEADMYIPTGLPGFYGLLFDRLDWDRFYLFVVEPVGRSYAVLRHDPGSSPWKFIVPFGWSAAINGGDGANHLKVERAGSQIKILVNNVVLGSATDGTYSGAVDEVGLFAQSLSDVPISFHYDNFQVTKLDLGAGDSSNIPPASRPDIVGFGQGVGFEIP